MTDVLGKKKVPGLNAGQMLLQAVAALAVKHPQPGVRESAGKVVGVLQDGRSIAMKKKREVFRYYITVLEQDRAWRAVRASQQPDGAGGGECRR